MTDSPSGHGTSDGLWRWLLGGLAGGGVVLGLLIGAYAVGYHRGRHHAPSTASAATATAPATTTAAAPAKPGALGPVTPTPALVARGKQLFGSDCAGCHSLGRSAGAGPGLGGLAGGRVELADGKTATADDAYLERSLTDPDAEIAKGFTRGIMSTAIASLHLESKPDDVRALVAFLKTQK